MYKNWNRKTGIKYIVGVACVYFIGAFVFFAIIFGIKYRGYEAAQIENDKILLLSLGLALIPVGSFSGFTTAFIGIDSISSKKLAFVVLFCIPIVVAMVPFGLVMIIPNIIVTIKSKNT